MSTKRKPKIELITQAEYARRRGLNKSTISRQVRDQIIPTHGERRLIDPAEADLARENNTDPTRGRRNSEAAQKPAGKTPKVAQSKKLHATPEKKPEPDNSAAKPTNKTSSASSYADARAYGQDLKNQQSEIELARLRGELIDRDAVRKSMAELAQAAVGAWIQWPARVYAEMAAELNVDSATLHQVLDRHVRMHAEDISRAPIKFTASEEEKKIA